eukprot:365288-Chlamydomonas_euryale.AAC.7
MRADERVSHIREGACVAVAGTSWLVTHANSPRGRGAPLEGASFAFDRPDRPVARCTVSFSYCVHRAPGLGHMDDTLPLHQRRKPTCRDLAVVCAPTLVLRAVGGGRDWRRSGWRAL